MGYKREHRMLHIDLARTIALVLVVLGHYNFMLHTFNIRGGHQFLLYFANGSLMAPAITIFFMLSGYSMMLSTDGALDLKKYYKRRFSRIFPAFWVAYILFFVINFFTIGIDSTIPKWKIMLSVIGMDGYLAYQGTNFYLLGEWFLGAVIIFYVLFPLFKFFIENYPKFFGGMTLALYVIINVYNPFQISLERNPIICMTACIAGMYISKYVKKIPMTVGVANLILSGIILFVPLKNWSVYICNILGFSMFLVIYWVADYARWRSLGKVCAFFSDISYSIFLLHHVILIRFLKRYANTELSEIRFVFLLTIYLGIVIICSYLLNKLINLLRLNRGIVFEKTWDIIARGCSIFTSKITALIKQNMLIATVVLTMIMAFIVYWKFLFGDYLYMMTYDATEQFWPFFSYLSGYIKSEGWPMWSFSIGLGSGVDASNLTDVFKLIPILCGRNLMPYIFAWMQWLKIVSASAFMFMYLRKISLHQYACSFGALTYAFCTIMIMRGNWYHYASELVYLALLLYLVERFFRDGKWKCLVGVLFVIFTSRGAYFLCLYSLLLFVYAVGRYFLYENGKIKHLVGYVLKCARIYLIALFLSGIFWVPSLYSMLNSARIGESDGAKGTPINVFSIKNLTYICHYILRAVKYDMVGSTDYYHGDYLNAPMFYISIFGIFCIFYGIRFSNGKAKKVIVFFWILALAYICLPGLRYVLNGFIAYQHLKLSCAWLLAGMVVCATMGIQKALIERKLSTKDLGITFLTVFLIIALAYIECIVAGEQTRILALLVAGVYFVLYGIFTKISIDFSGSIARKMRYGIALLICIELVQFSYETNDGFTSSVHLMKKSSIQDEIEMRYGTFSVIRDNDIFYRISANENFGYTNPLMGNYMDSSYYDTLVSSYRYFCEKVVPSASSDWALTEGINNNIGLESLIGCKYILKAPGSEPPYRCEYSTTINGYDVYENPNSFALGTTYYSIISEEYFLSLNEKEKGIAVLDSVIISDAAQKYLNHDEDIAKDMLYLEGNLDYSLCNSFFMVHNGIDEQQISGSVDKKLDVETDEEDEEIAIVISMEECYNDFDITFEMNSEIDSSILVTLSDGHGKYDSVKYEIDSGDNNIELIKEAQKVQYIVIRMSDPGKYQISNMTINYRDSSNYFNKYYEIFEKYVSEHQNDKFDILNFNQNKITGTIEAEKNAILLFSIPYDEGWSIKVDEKKVPIKVADFGLMAIEIDSGFHRVELSYVTPGLLWGVVLFFAGIGVFVFVIIREKKSGMAIVSFER